MSTVVANRNMFVKSRFLRHSGMEMSLKEKMSRLLRVSKALALEKYV